MFTETWLLGRQALPVGFNPAGVHRDANSGREKFFPPSLRPLKLFHAIIPAFNKLFTLKSSKRVLLCVKRDLRH